MWPFKRAKHAPPTPWKVVAKYKATITHREMWMGIPSGKMPTVTSAVLAHEMRLAEGEIEERFIITEEGGGRPRELPFDETMDQLRRENWVPIEGSVA